jgi:hypothetical protein
MSATTVNDLPNTRRLRRWLERLQFVADPFTGSQADQEGEVLPYLWVDRPYFTDILGDPSRPQTAFLLAGRGEGKTATREMVAYFAWRMQEKHKAFPVLYLDFSATLEAARGDPARVTARDHVHAIVRAAFLAIRRNLPTVYLDALPEWDARLLSSLAQVFADPVTQLKLTTVLRQPPPADIDWHQLSPVELLGTLVEIILKLAAPGQQPFQSIYILVDRVDEAACGLPGAALMLHHLVSEGALLEMSRVAYKFFVPLQVMAELRRLVNLREDRIAVRTISWDEQALEDMISQRVRYFSEGNVLSFADLCTADHRGSAFKRLIKASEYSPRRLIRLCEAVVQAHVSAAPDYELLFRRQDIAGALLEFEQQEEATISLTREPETPSAPSEPPPAGLYLDESGHVWIDGEPLAPPLSELEFQLLLALYRHAPNIVSHEELIQAIWESHNVAMDSQNLRKLVARVRERIEPGAPRFIKNSRGRGYWLQRN